VSSLKRAEGARDVLSEAVGEIVLGRIAALVGEHQDGDRQAAFGRLSNARRGRVVRRRQAPGEVGDGAARDQRSGHGERCQSHHPPPRLRWPDRRRAGLGQGCRIQGIGSDRPVDVLQRACAQGTERQGELVADLLVDAGRQHDRAGLRQSLQARREVDRVAEHVLVRHDDVAQMQTDAERLATLGGRVDVALEHAALQLDRRAHRLDGAGEFHQHAVAHRLDDTAMEALDHRADELGQMRAQIVEGLFLVGPHQAAVTVDVGEHDGRQTTIGAQARHRASVSPPRYAARRAGRRDARRSRRTPSRP